MILHRSARYITEEEVPCEKIFAIPNITPDVVLYHLPTSRRCVHCKNVKKKDSNIIIALFERARVKKPSALVSLQMMSESNAEGYDESYEL